MGEFLREEISGPLEADACIGATEDELKRFSKFVFPEVSAADFWSETVPKFGLEADEVKRVFAIFGRGTGRGINVSKSMPSLTFK